MQARPIGDFFNPFRGPLTPEDIEYIEQNMNLLLSDLYKNNQEELEQELQMALPNKIQGYLDVVGIIEKDPNVEINPEFGERMRALLKLVVSYYHKLN